MVHRGALAALLSSCLIAGSAFQPAWALTASQDGETGSPVDHATRAKHRKARAAKPARVAADTVAVTPEPAPAPLPAMPSGWLLTVKGNVLVSPDFPGSKNYGFIAYPTLSLRSPGTPETFKAPDDGVSLAVAGGDNWSVGAVGRYQTGRYRSSDSALYGIRDAKWALEPGLFGEFWALKDTIRLRGEIRYGINGYNGLVANLGVDLVKNVGQFTLSAGPRLALAGKDYMDTYFGVTAQDAFNNPSVTQYRPDGGVKSVGVAAAATYHWNDRWATTVHGGYDRLVGPAGDSPIVKAFGSRDQFFVGANASYSFPLGYTGP